MASDDDLILPGLKKDGRSMMERAAEMKQLIEAGELEISMPGDTYVPLGPGDPHVDGVFTSIISDRDRVRLRKIIRKVHFANYPTEMLTDYECDKLINAWGPKVAAYEIKRHMDQGDVD